MDKTESALSSSISPAISPYPTYLSSLPSNRGYLLIITDLRLRKKLMPRMQSPAYSLEILRTIFCQTHMLKAQPNMQRRTFLLQNYMRSPALIKIYCLIMRVIKMNLATASVVLLTEDYLITHNNQCARQASKSSQNREVSSNQRNSMNRPLWKVLRPKMKSAVLSTRRWRLFRCAPNKTKNLADCKSTFTDRSRGVGRRRGSAKLWHAYHVGMYSPSFAMPWTTYAPTSRKSPLSVSCATAASPKLETVIGTRRTKFARGGMNASNIAHCKIELCNASREAVTLQELRTKGLQSNRIELCLTFISSFLK